MKQLTSLLMLASLCLLTILSGCTQKSDQEMADESETDQMAEPASMAPEVVNPSVYTLLHEDDRVRILDMTLPAGVTDGMHTHLDEAVYFMTGSKVKVHLPEGEPADMDIPDGATLSHEAWTHSIENVGDQTIHAVIVEMKPGARDSAGIVAEGMSAAETSPENYTVLHEDDRVRILEMSLPAGTGDNEHAHPAEAAYFITGSMVTVHLPEGEPMQVDLPDGGVLSHPAWEHRVENTGTKDLRAIVVELKQPVM